jgi:uncharacterized hydantoinase/oxoprolinase family protein
LYHLNTEFRQLATVIGVDKKLEGKDKVKQIVKKIEEKLLPKIVESVEKEGKL